MNLDDLRSVQSDERRADSLQSLPEDFYRDVASYIEELREERERAAERAEDPFGSEEIRQLTDEIETAEEVAEAIYERRVGKVVKRASLAAAGMPADEEGLTAEERDLFSDLVDQIEAHRSNVLAAFSGEGEMASTSKAEDTTAPGESPPGSRRSTSGDPSRETANRERTDPEPPEDRPTADAATTVAEGAPDVGDVGGESEAEFDVGEAMGGSDPGEPERESVPTETDGGAVTTASRSGDREAGTERESSDATDRTTVRVTQDVGEIFGVDERTYHLGEEDVVTLPAENAEPLIERDAARKVE